MGKRKQILAETSDFGNQIINVITKYRLVTQPVLRKRFHKSQTEVKNEIRRLTQRELIASHPFIPGFRYYLLTRRACQSLGLSRRLSQPFGLQGLKMHYARLEFLLGSNPPKRLLDRSEVGFYFFGNDPPKSAPSLNGFFYLTDDDLISHIFVDCRSDARRLIMKAFQFAKKHSEHTGLRHAILQRRFKFTFITESEGKREAIIQAADRKELDEPLVHVCRDLMQL